MVLLISLGLLLFAASARGEELLEEVDVGEPAGLEGSGEEPAEEELALKRAGEEEIISEAIEMLKGDKEEGEEEGSGEAPMEENEEEILGEKEEELIPADKEEEIPEEKEEDESNAPVEKLPEEAEQPEEEQLPQEPGNEAEVVGEAEEEKEEGEEVAEKEDGLEEEEEKSGPTPTDIDEDGTMKRVDACLPGPCCALKTDRVYEEAWKIPSRQDPNRMLSRPAGNSTYPANTTFIVKLWQCFPLAITGRDGSCVEFKDGGMHLFRCLAGSFRHAFYKDFQIAEIACGQCRGAPADLPSPIGL